MADKKEWAVEGFQFGTQAEAEQAKTEALRIEKLESMLDYGNIEMVEAVYNKAVENRVFKTAVGYTFLKNLRDIITENKENAMPRDIPVIGVSGIRENTAAASPKIKPGKKKQKIKMTKSEFSQKTLLLLNAVWMLVIAVMFIITSKGETPNILNYERTLQNRYSAWEQELKERESVIREKERELLIESEAEFGTETGISYE